MAEYETTKADRGSGKPYTNSALRNSARLLSRISGARTGLIADVSSGSNTASSGLARAVMSAFRPLFSLNILGSSLGWQTIATARWPGEPTL